MAIDGKLLIKAKRELEARHAQRVSEIDRRTREVYAKSPRVRELDAQLRLTMPKLVGIALGEDKTTQTEDIRERIKTLHSERRNEMKKAGFCEDYLDDVYVCNICKDTGYASNRLCECLKKLYRAQQRVSLSNLLKMGNETFENFNLSYYDDTPAAGTDISPRQHMEVVFETCKEYASSFGENSMNLFLNGATGLGKTFLSACIARVVSDKDYSVVYDTAISIFSAYEDVMFSKAEDMSEARREIKRYRECDLLIIDDIGTEMTKEPTNEALYEIVNTRLITNRKTIVNSNLTIDEMRRRYSPQIMSRLEGEYQVLTFYGNDIRRLKNYAY